MSTRYLPTPLTDAYFSEFNREQIHSQIVLSVQAKTGQQIDRQNDQDLQVLMKRVYVNMARNQYDNIRSQIDAMNAQVVKEATATIASGVMQQLAYMRDITAIPVPMDAPVSTSTHGNKMPDNTKIAF